MKDLLPTINLSVFSDIVLPVYLQKDGALWLSMTLVSVKNWQVINSNIFLSIIEKIMQNYKHQEWKSLGF